MQELVESPSLFARQWRLIPFLVSACQLGYKPKIQHLRTSTKGKDDDTKLPTSDTLERMGTSFGYSGFWDGLCGQALVMIGRWCLRRPLTNHK